MHSQSGVFPASGGELKQQDLVRQGPLNGQGDHDEVVFPWPFGESEDIGAKIM